MVTSQWTCVHSAFSQCLPYDEKIYAKLKSRRAPIAKKKVGCTAQAPHDRHLYI